MARGEDLQPCKTMTDILAPVEHTNWALSAWNSTLDQNDILVRTICGQLVTLCLHLGRFNLGLKLMHTFKKHLKRPKIKQGTTSKVNCILFNRLLNPILLNKSGLVRAKAGNFNLKSLNRCFSNYYQMHTWRIFTEMVKIISRYNYC